MNCFDSWIHAVRQKKTIRFFGLVILLALLPLTSIAESGSGEMDKVETTLDQEIADVKPEADPDLVVADVPLGEPVVLEHSGIEEILVTAQKRSTNIQRTPTAITALSGAQLFDRGIYDVESLATQVPNFQYGETFGVARITIRGIGNQGFTDPSTAFHIDGIYQNNQTAASAMTFYDISQIEVLRGPQGTLWGRNSTAGAINVSTRAPVHEFELFGDMLRGSYEQWFGRGVVNIPIIQDRVALRTAVFFDQRDGYQENLTYSAPSRNADDADTWGIRPQILFDISDEISLTMRGGYNHQGGVGWGSKIQGDYPDPYQFGGATLVPATPPLTFVPQDLYTFIDPYHSQVGGINMEPNPTDPRQIRSNARQFQDTDTWDINGTLVWDFYMPGLGDMSFSVVGSYRSEARAQNFDVDLSDQNMIVSNVTASTRDRVIDAHLRSEGDTSTEWLLGFFMLDADGQLNVDLPGGGGSSNLFVGNGGRVCLNFPVGAPAPQSDCTPWTAFGVAPVLLGESIALSGARTGGSNDTLALAGYAHVRQKLFEDKLRVGLGLRYSWDRSQGTRYSDMVTVSGPQVLNTSLVYEDLFPATDQNMDGIPDNCIQPATSTDSEESWDGITGDLKIEFQPADEHMAYVSVSHGYKPGYINGNAVATGCPSDLSTITALGNAEEETLWAYEIGSKNRFLDNTVQANITGFIYQYDNLQVASQFDNTGYIQNAPRAQVRGIEFEGIWEPIEDLSLSVVYGYLNSKYLEYTGFNFATGEIEDFSGNTMIRAPEHTATLAAEYVWFLNGNGSIIPRIQYFISDEIYFNASNSTDSREPSYGTLQIRTRWESENDRMFIEGFVENLTDEDVRSTRSVGSGLLGRPITVAYEPPRTWGIRVGASY
jgi:iron complex outermembrane recepter protein